MPRLVLASASPARLALLRAAGFDPEVVVSNVDESSVSGTPMEIASVLAKQKARAVAAKRPDSLVLGCDSVLSLRGHAYGKPRDAAEALSRWQEMRGRTGVLHTGHCLIDTAGGREVAEVASTTVHFAMLSDEEIDAYVTTGEPLRVAGGFTIDGLGGPFVDRVEGDHHNVIGLSLPLFRRLVQKLGVSIPDLWSTSRG